MQVKIFLIIITTSYVYANNIQYKQFQNFMNVNKETVLNIQIQQHQFGKQYDTTGKLYFINDEKYVYDTKNQRISYDNGSLETINKATKQVIYDRDIDNSLSIINLLSGRDNRIEITETILDKLGNRISFFLNDWDLEGDIWTVPRTGRPIKIKLVLAVDEYMILNIDSLEIYPNVEIPEFEISGFEIIDLRE